MVERLEKQSVRDHSLDAQRGVNNLQQQQRRTLIHPIHTDCATTAHVTILRRVGGQPEVHSGSARRKLPMA